MERQRRASVLRFGTYEVDPLAGELRKSGLRIKVQQQPLKLLQILLEHPGEVVSREELRTQIWPNESFGDFDRAVNVAVAKLRGALSDSAENPRFIETIPRRGYRFLVDVSRVDGVEQPSTAGVLEVPAPGTESVLRPRARPAWLITAASLALLGLFASAYFRSRSREQTPAPAPPIRSLAVLPLENLSAGDQDYFADGMTDELITDLAQIGALRVISRTSVMTYKGARKPLPVVAHELNVDAVVEGTVLRSGDRVRITAQLIEAAADRHLWANSYEGELRNTLALQKQVAREIADQIRIELTPHETAILKRTVAVNPEAYEAYLKGRFFFSKRNNGDKALAYFQQATQIDPNYADPYAGLSDFYQVADNTKLAREAVNKALALDDQLAGAHSSLAQLMYTFDHDWPGAEREFKRAIDLDPNYAPAHHWYSIFLSLQGRKQQALAEAQNAFALDPLSPVVGANLAKILEENGQLDSAMAQANKTLELDPNSAVTHAVLGVTYEDKRMYSEAIAEYKNALRLGGPPGEMRGLLGYVYAVSGDGNSAEEMVKELKQLWPAHVHAALDLAVVYSGLHQTDQALYWLDMARNKEVGDLIGITQNPHLATIREDSRFQAIVKQIGIPQ